MAVASFLPCDQQEDCNPKRFFQSFGGEDFSRPSWRVLRQRDPHLIAGRRASLPASSKLTIRSQC